MAIEERDRAEDEASSKGCRRPREPEELNARMRETERALRTAQLDIHSCSSCLLSSYYN